MTNDEFKKLNPIKPANPPADIPTGTITLKPPVPSVNPPENPRTGTITLKPLTPSVNPSPNPSTGTITLRPLPNPSPSPSPNPQPTKPNTKRSLTVVYLHKRRKEDYSISSWTKKNLEYYINVYLHASTDS